jgi:hypothetical protein
MDRLSDPRHAAVCYVLNASGEVTKEKFLDDHAPLGDLLWDDIHEYLLENEDGTLSLSSMGLDYTKEHAR